MTGDEPFEKKGDERGLKGRLGIMSGKRKQIFPEATRGFLGEESEKALFSFSA